MFPEVCRLAAEAGESQVTSCKTTGAWANLTAMASWPAKFQARRGQLKRKEYWTRPQLERYQARRLAQLRRFVYAHSPFYRKFHEGLEDRPLAELPILTKAVFMERLDELVTDRTIHQKDIEAYVHAGNPEKLFSDRYFVTASSGTSGNRMYMLSSPSEWLTTLASLVRQATWTGMKPERRRLAQVLSTVSTHGSALAAKSLNNQIGLMLMLDAADPLKTVVSSLNEWQPQVMTMYASVARLLADEQLKGRLQISPEVVCTGGDVMTPEIFQMMQHAWGNTPYNTYAATESSVLAADCSNHAGLHIFEDLVIIENLTLEGKPVPLGEFGQKLAITVLFRHTMPLIRYELPDIVRMTENQCPCGRTFRNVSEIVGRTDQVLWVSNRSGQRIPLHPNFFIRTLDPLPVKQWQVINRGDSWEIVVAEPRDGLADETVIQTMAQAVDAHNAAPPPIRVTRVHEIPRGKMGKTMLVRSEPTMATTSV